MIQRALSPRLKTLASRFPVVVISGPRQSGKTTLAKMAFPGYAYVSLENVDNRRFAMRDPRAFLEQYSKCVIIDEAQHVPELLSYIQTAVDEKRIPGRYIITGSQQFNLLHKVSQSLAGRAAYLRLLPFTVAELLGKKARNPDKFPPPPAKPSARARLTEFLYSGFYPRIHNEKIAPSDFLSSYITAYVERDVRDALKIGDLMGFQNFVRLCAGRSGQILNLSSLAADCGISHTTARSWLSVLEASSIVFTLTPYYRNFSKRIIKSPKLYFMDTGLMCHLLRIRKPQDAALHPLYGNIFETFVIGELYKSFCNAGEVPPLYFWRDMTGREIDLIIESARRLTAVEIKAGKTISGDFFDNLKYFAKIAKSATTLALVYAGADSRKQEGVHVRTWQELS
ncbi:MAG: ATP-binding protein [Elusimicrobiales bacterium]|nr:ATP-binding protein [Elusimicrobiales bacterium]